ncbi:hypothetical protein L218DRAFT_56460 [Marasmius fiardii PR-910]|nr:hypothetical protein L218DRAFT_56460 [Marasmius fiardii PR-910]
MPGATLEHATLKHATCHGHSLLNGNPTPLLPTPPNSAGLSPTFFIPSSPNTLNKGPHYQTFTQARLLTPPNSAELPLEHHSPIPPLKKLHRVSSHFQITKSRSLNRPISTMGFIGSKRDKEKSKEEKEKSTGKGKEKERKAEQDLSVEDHGDGNASNSKFSLTRTPSWKSKKDKSLKKKRSVARLLLLAATGSPSTTLLPPSPKDRSHVHSVSTAELLSSPHEEKPVPLVIPAIPNDEECDENDGAYAYAVEHRDAHFATKYITKDRWHTRNNMKLHPYGSDAVYMQSYEHMSLNNDRHFNMLLRRINRNGSPSFHDYSKLGETPPSCALDLACGQGHWLLQAATQWPNSKIVGLDLVDVALPQVLEKENITLVRGNFLHYALPFPSQSFDYVRIANASLAIPYEKWRFVLKEVQRVLTRGGRLEVIDDQFIFPYVTQKESTTSRSVPGIPGPTSASGVSKTHQQKCSSSFSTLNHTPSSSMDVGEDGDRTGDDDKHWLGKLGDIPSAHHNSDGDANPDDVDGDDVPMVPDNRRRCSSLPLGPRPNVRPLSMSAETWRKRLAVEEADELTPEALPLSPVSDDSTEKESEAPTLSPDDSSSDEDEDYGQEFEVKVPLEEEFVPSPGLLGPRPNARPMSMNGEKWKDRLNFSLWNNTTYEHEVVEGSTDSSSEGSGENCTNRISSSSTISSSEWSFSACSTASTASTAPSSIMEDVEDVEVTRPAKQVRPLPSTPLQCEEETDDADDPLVSHLTQDESDFVSSPDEEDSDDFFVDSTPMTTPSVKLSFERNEKEHWETQAAHSREIETVFNDMLVNKYGVNPDPCAFLTSAMEQVFGEGKAGRMCSMHLMLAPEEFRSYVEDETSPSEGRKEKKAAVRWSDELDKDGEKDKSKAFGTSIEKDTKEKHQRARALTEPSPPRDSNDSTASLGLPPGLSAKAALRLGITYTALANAAAESRNSSDSSSPSSSSSNLASPLDDPNRHKQSPGLLLWPSTLIPLSPGELEMHACKNMHDVLGCKPALAEWVGGYVDENGQRVVGDKEFEDAMWEYECFRRKRLNWPENLPEMNMDARDVSASLITPATNIEIPTTPRRAYHEKTVSDTSSTSTDATVTPTPPQALAGGMYAKEDLTHVRTIRVYEAVKSWRKRTLSPESDDNKTPTSASPPCSAA